MLIISHSFCLNIKEDKPTLWKLKHKTTHQYKQASKQDSQANFSQERTKKWNPAKQSEQTTNNQNYWLGLDLEKHNSKSNSELALVGMMPWL